MLLDVSLLNELRIRAGLSRRALRNRLGMSAGKWRAVVTGRNHESLTVGFLFELAAALGTHPAALIAGGRDGILEVTDDAAKLEAALLAAGKFVHADALCLALDWELPRFIQASKSLRARVDGTGAVLVTARTGLALQPRVEVLSQDEQHAVQRAALPAGGMRTTSAKLLRQLAAGQGGDDLEWGAPDRQALGELLSLGYLVTDGENFRLSDAVRASFAPYLMPTRVVPSLPSRSRSRQVPLAKKPST